MPPWSDEVPRGGRRSLSEPTTEFDWDAVVGSPNGEFVVDSRLSGVGGVESENDEDEKPVSYLGLDCDDNAEGFDDEVGEGKFADGEKSEAGDDEGPDDVPLDDALPDKDGELEKEVLLRPLLSRAN